MRIVRARCPLRLSFAGGGTDVPPYPEERGGAVLSCTIDKFAHATITMEEGQEIHIESLDYDVVAKYKVDKALPYDGTLDLVKAAVNRLDGPKEGLRVFLHNDAPPGSGLGSSSALVVAIAGAFGRWLQRPMTDYEVASLACQVERQDAGIQGGLQDQYACTFGGFNYIEFFRDAVVVNPLRIEAEISNELSYRLLLCYTGATRATGALMETQVRNYQEHKPAVMAALDNLREIAVEMKNSLLRGELDNFGELLHVGWQNKKKLAEGIGTSEIDELYDLARANGALGGKLTGAGGGGYMLFICEFNKRHTLAKALERHGAQVVPFSFENEGLQTWETKAPTGTPAQR